MASIAASRGFRFAHRLLLRNPKKQVDSLYKDSTRFASVPNFLQNVVSNEKLVFFGEIHSEIRIVEFLRNLLAASAANLPKNAKLHIVMEHFSLDMNKLLDTHLNSPTSTFDFETFKSQYLESGAERHNLDPYKEFFEDVFTFIKDNKVKIHGGFVPRPIASKLYHAHKSQDFEQVKSILDGVMWNGWIPAQDHSGSFFKDAADGKSPPLLDSSMAHQIFFKSLMGLELDYELLENIRQEAASDESKMELLKTMQETFENDVGKSGIFQAQLLKDACMGHFIAKLMANEADSFGTDDRVLVVLGKGHCGHYTGAVEFYKKATKELSKTFDGNLFPLPYTILNTMSYEVDIEDEDKVSSDAFDKKIMNSLSPMMRFDLNHVESHSDETSNDGGILAPYADAVFVYDEDEDNENTCDDFGYAVDLQLKSDTKAAYETVGASMLKVYNDGDNESSNGGKQKLHGKRNLPLAIALIKYLGYKDDHIKNVSDLDLVNFQGVGCPFEMLERVRGHVGKNTLLPNSTSRVLDLGCGLGFDSFLAANYFNCELIAGVDLSKTQIEWCKERLQRNETKDTQIKFLNADIETLGECVALQDFKGTFSHVISNGAFCLLPSKKKGFQTAYDFLKDGGVIAICCTVIKDNDKNPVIAGSSGNSWPLCMRTFGRLSEIGNIAKGVGFKNVLVDTENSLMEYNLEYEDDNSGVLESKGQENTSDSSLYKIHGKNAKEFSHLAKYNMNDLCCRVVIYGEK